MKKLLLIVVSTVVALQLRSAPVELMPSELQDTYEYGKRWAGLLVGGLSEKPALEAKAPDVLMANAPQVNIKPCSVQQVQPATVAEPEAVEAVVETEVQYHMPAPLVNMAYLQAVSYVPPLDPVDLQADIDEAGLKDLEIEFRTVQELNQKNFDKVKAARLQFTKKVLSLKSLPPKPA